MASAVSWFILIAGSIAAGKGILTYIFCRKRYSKPWTIGLTVAIPIVTFFIMYFILGLLLKP